MQEDRSDRRNMLQNALGAIGATRGLLALRRVAGLPYLPVLTFHRVRAPASREPFLLDDGVVDATPDEFERRLSKESNLADKIARAVKPHGALISGVFFDVDQGDEIDRQGPDDTYTLDIIILHSAEPDFAAAETAAQQAAGAISRAFKDKLFTPTSRWQQIELRSCEPVSESVLTYHVFKQLKRWPDRRRLR